MKTQVMDTECLKTLVAVEEPALENEAWTRV